MNQQLKQVEQTEYPLETEITYPYSVKCEQSAKGCRVSVHVYGKTSEETVKEAIETYRNTRKQLEDAGLLLAPEQ